MFLSDDAVNLLALSLALALLAVGYSVGTVFCDPGVHAIVQQQLFTMVPKQEVRQLALAACRCCARVGSSTTARGCGEHGACQRDTCGAGYSVAVGRLSARSLRRCENLCTSVCVNVRVWTCVRERVCTCVRE